MIGHPKIELDTVQKDTEVDALIVLCQWILSYMGTWFPTGNGSPVAILNYQAVEMKLVSC